MQRCSQYAIILPLFANTNKSDMSDMCEFNWPCSLFSSPKSRLRSIEHTTTHSVFTSYDDVKPLQNYKLNDDLCYNLTLPLNKTHFKPFKPSRCIKASFYITVYRPNFPTTRGLWWKFPRNCFTNKWQFSLIFHALQVIFIHYKSRIATAIRGFWQW